MQDEHIILSKHEMVLDRDFVEGIVPYLEMARLGMAMVGDEIAEEMDLSDEEFIRLRDRLQNYMEDLSDTNKED